MTEFLVYQQILVSQTQPTPFTINNDWDCIIRKVLATNEDEAIGKFLRNTSDIRAVQKLNPVCFKFETLKIIE